MDNHTVNRSLEALFKHLIGAYAPNTLRAYHADMQEFITYCEKHSLCPLPAAPQEVASFLMATISQGIKASTIQRKAASISAIHRGTVATRIAAKPESTVRSAKVINPLPPTNKRVPTTNNPRQVPGSGRILPPAKRNIERRQIPAVVTRIPPNNPGGKSFTPILMAR